MDTCHPADLQETGRGGPWCPGRCEAPAGVDGGGVLQPPSCPARSSAPQFIHKTGAAKEGGSGWRRKGEGVRGEGAAGSAAGKLPRPPPASQRWPRRPQGGEQEAPAPSPARPAPPSGRPALTVPFAGCPRSGAQQARGGSMPLLRLLGLLATAPPPRAPPPPPPRAPTDERRPRRAALSTERVPAGRGALLRPWGRESWQEWEDSLGAAGAPCSRLATTGTRGSRGPAWTRLLRLA